MARPRKEGLDYFPHDVFASSDEKLEALLMLYGAQGYAFYFLHLEYIYRKTDLAMDISDEEVRQVLCHKLKIGLEEYETILRTALKRGCFDAAYYESTGRLTSNGIKKRGGLVFGERLRWENRQRAAASDENHGGIPEESRSNAAASDENHGGIPEAGHKGKESKRKGKETPNGVSDSCAEPPQAATAAPAVLVFPLAGKDGGEYPITQADIDQWQEAFPGVNVLLTLRHCLQWSRDNPTRRKTRNGIRNHITSWLAREQNRARPPTGGQAQAPPMTARQRYMREIGDMLIPDEPEEREHERDIIDITPKRELDAAQRATGTPRGALPGGGT